MFCRDSCQEHDFSFDSDGERSSQEIHRQANGLCRLNSPAPVVEILTAWNICLHPLPLSEFYKLLIPVLPVRLVGSICHIDFGPSRL